MRGNRTGESDPESPGCSKMRTGIQVSAGRKERKGREVHKGISSGSMRNPSNNLEVLHSREWNTEARGAGANGVVVFALSADQPRDLQYLIAQQGEE